MTYAVTKVNSVYYRLNSCGPKTEPWGMPSLITAGSHNSPHKVNNVTVIAKAGLKPLQGVTAAGRVIWYHHGVGEIFLVIRGNYSQDSGEIGVSSLGI